MPTDGGPATHGVPRPAPPGSPTRCLVRPGARPAPVTRIPCTAASGLACWRRTDSGGSDRSGPTDGPRQEGADQEDPMSGHGMDRRTFLGRGAAAAGAVVLAGGAGTGLAACSSAGGSSSATTAPSGPTAAPTRGGSMTIGTMAEIDGFSPSQNRWDTNGLLYANTVYDPLMAVAEDGSIQPYLAEVADPQRGLRRVDAHAAAGRHLPRRDGVDVHRREAQLRRTGHVVAHQRRRGRDRLGHHAGRDDGRLPAEVAGHRLRRRAHHPGRLHRGAGDTGPGARLRRSRRWARGRSCSARGSRTATSPPRATPTTGSRACPTSTRSPSGPSWTPPNARTPSRPGRSTPSSRSTPRPTPTSTVRPATRRSSRRHP